MKYSEVININVSLTKDKFYCNEIISGELSIQNNHDTRILIKNILIDLIIKHHGRGESSIYNLERKIISDYNAIKPNETITLKFKFNPVYNITYIGENMSQNVIIKTKVDIKSESEKELRKLAIGKLKVGSFFRGVFKPDFYNEAVVKVLRGDVNYEIQSAKGIIMPGMKNALIMMGASFVILLFFSFVLYNILDNQLEIFYISTTIFLLVAGALYFFKITPSLKTGKIKYTLNNIEGNFYEAVLNFEKRNRNVKEIDCQLLAIEKVTYDNGSSRSTITKTLYQSKQHNINSFGSSIREEIELPKESLPLTINNGDFEVIWKLKIIATTHNNLKLVGTSVIDVGFEKREKLLDSRMVDFT